MSIKFGMLTNPKLNIVDEIKLIKKLGFDYVELGIELPEGSPDIALRKKSKILDAVKAFNHPSLVHTAWWIDLGSGYEHIREAWVEEGKVGIDTAKALGIKLINFHFYSIGLVAEYKAYHKSILSNIVKSLRELTEYASREGLTVMYENAPLKKENVGIQEYKFVLSKVPKLKAHIDIGHSFVENGMEGIRQYLFTFKDRIAHIHLHDNNGDSDEHLPLGTGKIDVAQVAKWLKQIKYNKTITFEVFTSKEDAKQSMLKFKKLL